VVQAGLTLLSIAPPTVSQVSSSPWSTGSEGGISYDNTRFNCQNIVLTGKYSTTLLAVPTSWLVDSVIFNFWQCVSAPHCAASSAAREC
jgi:hypothetical protein